MQMAVPETLQLDKETESTRKLYGLDQGATQPFGRLCLVARRLVERGVRFIQVFHGGGGGGAWDAHSGIKGNHSTLAAQVDLPIAGLLKDLKQRGLSRRRSWSGERSLADRRVRRATAGTIIHKGSAPG
jgi:hypothetical protein